MIRRLPTGHYVSAGTPWEWKSNPVYVVVAAARDLIQAGNMVHLPIGYDVEGLDRIAWITGYRDDRSVPITARQADELASIARVLKYHHGKQLRHEQLEAVDEVLAAVVPEGPDD